MHVCMYVCEHEDVMDNGYIHEMDVSVLDEMTWPGQLFSLMLRG